MVDYYSILSRAVTASDAGGAQWRRGVYDRARRMLLHEMRARRPPAPAAEIRAEQSALEAAIARIEAEIAQPQMPRGIPAEQQIAVELEAEPQAAESRFSPVLWIALAVVAAAVAAGGYVLWPRTAHTPLPQQMSAAGQGSGPALPLSPVRKAQIIALKDGDLPPGIDGGSTDADLPYFFRRQPTFYRTTNPPGTIIIDKLQHFLYLTQPNNIALRYGIGIGEQCIDLVGLRRIANKAEWPEWTATPDMIQRKLAKAGTLPGGPGNPLGARVLALDDGSSRINGTNAPKTIGTSVIFGCIRLVNDDIVDLYGRVPDGTRVILQ